VTEQVTKAIEGIVLAALAVAATNVSSDEVA